MRENNVFGERGEEEVSVFGKRNVIRNDSQASFFRKGQEDNEKEVKEESDELTEEEEK